MKKLYIIAIIGAIIMAFGVKYSLVPRDDRAKLKSAVYIDDGKIDRANEGRVVILSGRLDPQIPFVDPETKINIPYFIVERNVETFEKISKKDQTYFWRAVKSEGNRENRGVNLEGFTTTKLIQPTRLGDFNIDPRIFANIFPRDDWKVFDDKELASCNLYKFVSRNDGKTYFSQIPDIHDTYQKYEGSQWADQVGKKKCSYKIYQSDGPLDFTIIGVQKGDWIMEAKDINVSPAQEGIMTAKKFVKKATSWRNFVGMVIIIPGLAIASIAGYLIFIRKRG